MTSTLTALYTHARSDPYTHVNSECRYTGEDGFELSIPSSAVLEVAEALVADERVRMTGLGARDSLRLEAGLCLYGVLLVWRTHAVERHSHVKMQSTGKLCFPSLRFLICAWIR